MFSIWIGTITGHAIVQEVLHKAQTQQSIFWSKILNSSSSQKKQKPYFFPVFAAFFVTGYLWRCVIGVEVAQISHSAKTSEF